jgi:hypothetical protein
MKNKNNTRTRCRVCDDLTIDKYILKGHFPRKKAYINGGEKSQIIKICTDCERVWNMFVPPEAQDWFEFHKAKRLIRHLRGIEIYKPNAVIK